jgi:hypothetical protein
VPESINEVDFCALMTVAADAVFRERPDLYLRSARVEGAGSGALGRRRKDLRFCGPSGALVLTGEV